MLAAKLGPVFAHLVERQRMMTRAEARILGHGGIRVVADHDRRPPPRPGKLRGGVGRIRLRYLTFIF